jgi:hypothetical protein
LVFKEFTPLLLAVAVQEAHRQLVVARAVVQVVILLAGLILQLP